MEFENLLVVCLIFALIGVWLLRDDIRYAVKSYRYQKDWQWRVENRNDL